MPAYSGRDFLLKVNISSVYTTIGGMRTTSLTLNNAAVDISTKSTGAWRKLLAQAGIRRLRLSAAGVFENSAAEETIRAAAFNHTALTMQLAFGNGDTLTGQFLIVGYDRSGDVDGEETYAITLESADTITFTKV